jgi:hypothetical protein
VLSNRLGDRVMCRGHRASGRSAPDTYQATPHQGRQAPV